MPTRPDVDVHTMGALIRLADALDTSVEELLLHAPPSWNDPVGDSARLEGLDLAECRRLLATAQIARVAYDTADGPGVLPVNLAVVQGRPVFRTAPGSPLARLGGQRVAVEVDRVDVVRREGWSVVVTGVAHVVAAEALNGPDARECVEPWPGGQRDTYVFVQPGRTTGRRVVRDDASTASHRSSAQHRGQCGGEVRHREAAVVMPRHPVDAGDVRGDGPAMNRD